MNKYGLISQTDGQTIEKTIDLILKSFPEGVINVCEVGIYGGKTGDGIRKYINSKERKCFITGIDSGKDGELVIYPYDNLIIGNSNEVYNQLHDGSQHLIIIDANHSFPYIISDFYCYEDKIKYGGFLLFHDTGKHIEPFTDYQGSGDKMDGDMYISVRKALKKIGLLNNVVREWWLFMDEADETDCAGGICVFKKIKKWD